MGEIIEMNNANNSEANGIYELSEDMLLDVRTEPISKDRALSVPIVELASLGGAVSSLIPALSTVTQTMNVNTSGLYQLANEALGDTLKVAKNGNFWGAFKTADGASKFVQLKAADPLKVTTETAVKANPATIMMAAALFSIEKELGEIAEMEKQILSFLQIEKQAKIEGDVTTLNRMIKDYKSSWDNNHFIDSYHQTVCDILRDSRSNMIEYKKNVAKVIENKKIIFVKGQVNSKLEELLKMFKYYRLSLYTFSLASLLEIMLSGNFKEEHINNSIEEVRRYSDEYRELFADCSVIIENMAKGAIDSHVLKGIGIAGNAMGNLIGNIAKKKDVTGDNFLQDKGQKLIHNAEELKLDVVKAFSEVSNPNTRGLINKMEDMVQIYGRTKEICFDKDNIYFIA